jgi:hypothetical protein
MPLCCVRCPLPGVCVGAHPLLNPIHKTHPTTKYAHLVNSSVKQRKKSGFYQSKEQQSVIIARLSARPKHPHEPIIASEPQWFHGDTAIFCPTYLAIIALRKTVHLNKQPECITICPNRHCNYKMIMHKTMDDL